MAADESKRAIGSPTGGTGGTGQPDTNPETPAGSVAERERDSDSLAGGDGSTDAAIGERGADRVSGTGAPAQSGRRSGEGAGGSLPNPPDPGDPGGMGGVATNRTSGHDRPPGGVSPVPADED